MKRTLSVILLFSILLSAFASAAGADYLAVDDDVLNILLLGTDVKLPGTQDKGRSDCTMLASLNLKEGTVKLASFERGIYVTLPGVRTDLLTHIYEAAGADGMVSVIEDYFKVRVDAYAQVDVSEFATVIDAIGGIDIMLTQVEADTMNGKRSTNMVSNMEVHEGLNHLDGQAAAAYCRLRSPDDDWARQQRQRNAIQAAVTRAASLSATEIISLIATVLPLVNTNLSAKQIARITFNVKKFIDSTDAIQEIQIPEKNRTESGGIACDFDSEAIRLKEFIYG